MEKEKGKIRFVETDDGYRIEVTGKDLKDLFSCCCVPIACTSGDSKVVCCEPGEKKK